MRVYLPSLFCRKNHVNPSISMSLLISLVVVVVDPQIWGEEDFHRSGGVVVGEEAHHHLEVDVVQEGVEGG